MTTTQGIVTDRALVVSYVVEQYRDAEVLYHRLLGAALSVLDARELTYLLMGSHHRGHGKTLADLMQTPLDDVVALDTVVRWKLCLLCRVSPDDVRLVLGDPLA